MKQLAIKKSGYGSYFVVNHNWAAFNGPIEIYKSAEGENLWRSSFTDSLYSSLKEAKAETFACLESNGMGVAP